MDDATATEATEVLRAVPDTVEPLVHSVRASTTAGVRRLVAGGRSAVVKVVSPRSTAAEDASRDPASFRYWRREAELLGAAALDPYRDAGIRPPRLLASFERPDGSLALWLEDVRGLPGAGWTLDVFRAAARRLGRAQGAAARGGTLELPFLARRFLRSYLADVATRVPYRLLEDDEAWRRGLAGRHFAPALRGPLGRLHAEAARFVGWVEAAPATLAHHDVWPHNLFAVAAAGSSSPIGAAPEPFDAFVLIDWAFAGIGALGEDAGNLVLDSAWDLLHPAALLPDLDRSVREGYLEGLREAGWDGDERLVRLAMCATAVKYDWLAAAMLERAAELERDAGSERRGRLTGYGGTIVADPDRLFAERAAGLAFMLERADEARRLAAELGLG